MVGKYLMAGDSERQQWNGVEKVWEDDSDGLMMYDRREDGGNVFDGGKQRAATVEQC
jgi:hypothetical protein